MNNLKNKWTLILLTTLLGVTTGCGTTGSESIDFENVSINYDFRIVSTSPQNGATNINASTNTIQVFFSEEVDPATIQGNIQIKKDVSGSPTNVDVGPEDITPNGNMLDIEVEAGTLSENTVYHVIFLPGLTSVNQNTLYDGQLSQGVEVVFNTGVGYGNSVSGPPQVQSINQFNNFNGCFSAIIRFNEDIAVGGFNDVIIESTLIFGTGGGQVTAAVYPYYQYGRTDVWVAEVPNCSLLGVWSAIQQITVTVNDAVDLEGNHLAAPVSETF